MPVATGGKIFIRFALIQLVSAAVILGWFIYSLRTEANERRWQNAQQTVLSSLEATERYFRPAETVVRAFQHLLSTDVLDFDRPELIEHYLFGQLRQQDQFAGLFVGYPDGKFLYLMRSDQESASGTRTKLIVPTPGGRDVSLVWRDASYSTVKATKDPQDKYDPRTRPWYKAAVEAAGVAWTKPYIFFSSRRPGITASVAVRDADDSIAAVVGVDIEMSDISRFLGQMAFGQNGSAFIVTSEGELIGHSTVADVLAGGVTDSSVLKFRKVSELGGVEGAAADRIVRHFSENHESRAPAVWEQSFGGQTHFVALGHMPNANWPWLIAAIVPERKLRDVVGSNPPVLIGIIMLAAILACGFGYILSQSISLPLARLLANAKLASRGNIELMEDVQSGYREIDETASVLHDMAASRRGIGLPKKEKSTTRNSE